MTIRYQICQNVKRGIHLPMIKLTCLLGMLTGSRSFDLIKKCSSPGYRRLTCLMGVIFGFLASNLGDLSSQRHIQIRQFTNIN